VTVADTVGVPYKRRMSVKPSLDGVVARASQPIQQRGTATHARYGCPGQASAHALGCAG
jgi:hypothetical protein